jgi:hypothetical protein
MVALFLCPSPFVFWWIAFILRLSRLDEVNGGEKFSAFPFWFASTSLLFAALRFIQGFFMSFCKQFSAVGKEITLDSSFLVG